MANAHGTTKVGSYFQAAFTTSESGLENSSSHHRVVRHALGDLRCVVRFEADACCEEKEDPQGLDKRCVNFFSPLREEDLRAKFNQMSSIQPGGAADTSQHTSVLLGGRIVPSSTVVELKTYHSDNFRIDLWFGLTPKLLVGTHTDGTFHKLESFHVSSQLLEWEITHQVELRELTWLIAELREATRRTPAFW